MSREEPLWRAIEEARWIIYFAASKSTQIADQDLQILIAAQNWQNPKLTALSTSIVEAEQRLKAAQDEEKRASDLLMAAPPGDSADKAALEEAHKKAVNSLKIAKDDISRLKVEAEKLAGDTGKLALPASSDEARFWQAYRNACAAISPITIDSLRNNLIADQDLNSVWRWLWHAIWPSGPLTRAKSMVRFYRVWALVFIVTLVSYQVYLVTGQSLVNDAIKLKESIRSDYSTWTELINEVQTAREQVERAEETLKSAEDNNQDVAKAQKDLKDAKNTLSNAQKKLNSFIPSDSDSKLQENIRSLENWVSSKINPLLWLGFVDPDSFFEILKLEGCESLPSASSEEQPTQAKPPECESDEWKDRKIETILYSSRATLAALSNYLLPLLAGFIGAFAYVLRNLETEIREIRLRSVAVAQYALRITLGGLAGATIGWFFGASGTTETTENVSSDSLLPVNALGPSAIGLIAGYSIELLFTAIDRVLIAFGAKPSNEASAPSPTPAATNPKPDVTPPSGSATPAASPPTTPTNTGQPQVVT